jgi:hypothetical protein
VKTETYLNTLKSLVVSNHRAHLQLLLKGGKKGSAIAHKPASGKATAKITLAPDGPPYQGNSGLKNPQPTAL